MAGLYITKKKQNKKAISDNWWFAGLSIILLLTALVKRKAVKNGFSRQGNVWRAFLTGKTGKIWLDYPVHGKAGSVLAAVLLAVLLGMLLFVLVKKKRTGMLLVVWTIWMAGYGIGFFRKRWGLFAGTLFLAIYFACRSGMAGDSLRKRFWKNRIALAGALVLIAGICLAGSGIVKEILERTGADTLNAGHARLELAGKIHAMRYDHGETALTEGVLTDVKQRTQSKKTALLVTMEHPQKLYLRQMTGEIYTGSSWEPLDAKDRKEGKALFYWMHRSGLYGQNVTGEALGLSGKKKTASVIVENISACEKNRYLPYGLKAGTAFAEDVIGDTENPAQTGKEKLTYYTGSTADWYKQAVWIEKNQKEQKVQQYLKKEEAYRKFVYAKDLRLTNTAIGVMEELLKNEKKEEHSLTEILKLVRDTLANQLNYNEAVRTDNGKQDFLRYTFEQTKNGYDVHYATAATLMLRYLGVPARYVEGYYMSVDEMRNVKAGQPVKIKKKQAHAWTEYYLDGVGWIPFEVTPGYTDKEDEQKLSDILSGTNGKGGAAGKLYQKSGQTYEPQKADGQQEKSSNDKPVFRGQTGKHLLWLFLLILVLVIVGISVIILWKRRKKLVSFEIEVSKMEPAAAVAELYGYSQKLMELCEVKVCGMEVPVAGFAGATEADETCAQAESERMHFLNQKARFSGHTVSEKERKEMLAYVEKVICLCKKRRSKWKCFRDHYLCWRYR